MHGGGPLSVPQVAGVILCSGIGLRSPCPGGRDRKGLIGMVARLSVTLALALWQSGMEPSDDRWSVSLCPSTAVGSELCVRVHRSPGETIWPGRPFKAGVGTARRRLCEGGSKVRQVLASGAQRHLLRRMRGHGRPSGSGEADSAKGRKRSSVLSGGHPRSWGPGRFREIGRFLYKASWALCVTREARG